MPKNAEHCTQFCGRRSGMDNRWHQQLLNGEMKSSSLVYWHQPLGMTKHLFPQSPLFAISSLFQKTNSCTACGCHTSQTCQLQFPLLRFPSTLHSSVNDHRKICVSSLGGVSRESPIAGSPGYQTHSSKCRAKLKTRSKSQLAFQSCLTKLMSQFNNNTNPCATP